MDTIAIKKRGIAGDERVMFILNRGSCEYI